MMVRFAKMSRSCDPTIGNADALLPQIFAATRAFTLVCGETKLNRVEHLAAKQTGAHPNVAGIDTGLIFKVIIRSDCTQRG
tara:strand:+ start:204 stop:446 length:243 start_codon:yes stop_codon:yes gene_type:complete